jgi:RNA polymerase sigma factor (sigma-70 family)
LVTRLSDVRHAVGDYESLDDRVLVLDFQAGHPEAFVEIHRRYGGLARHVCRRLLPNTHDSDEAFQETMIRVFQGLHRFNGRYALQPWISRIATNVSLDMIRSRARRPALDERAIEEHDHEDRAAGPEETFEQLVQRDLVLAVLSDLPDTHRRALILREIEGRSHREIGDVIGISPAQAKALIHRAKGSFRRRWMQKAVERGGIPGIALLPLLWLARLGDIMRRAADRAGHAVQAAQAAVPDVVTSASQTVASSVGGGFGERVVAASMTLLVAGGVTVGAATIVKDRNEGDRVVRTEAPAAVTTPALDPVEVTEREPRPRFDDVAPKEPQGPPEVLEETVVVEPSPTVEPPVAAESPTPEPTESPSPEPTEEPSPEPLPPAPPWTIGVQTWGSWSLSCDCSRSFNLMSSEVEGETSGQVYFVQEVIGEAVGSDGVPAWQLSAVYSGYAEGSQGRFSLFLDVETADGEFRYEAWGVLEDTEPTGVGGLQHTYKGGYRLVSFRPADGLTEVPAALPSAGALTAETTWWADGTSLVGVVLVLEER